MQSLSKLTLFLCCIWSISLLYGEMVSFWLPLWTCSWPQPHHSSPTTSGIPYSNDRVKVAVLADPQLMDRTSLGLPPKSLALEAIQFYADLYMRRSFHASILPFKPDVILFLGDHFDGGPFLSDEEWQQSLSRFKHIFDMNQRGGTSHIKVYYLAGNHDIGYAGFHSLHPTVISRYEKEFGMRNYRFTVGKVEFIVVDAQTLDGPSQRTLTSEAWNFVKNASTDALLNPRVLLTHIPLYRPNGTPCGPYRSSPIINQRVSRTRADEGIMYQNYLTEETSAHLLDLIRPILVLSAHDHDQCSVTHQTAFGLVKEHTVGTLSWQQGNLHPSFMLLSVGESSNATGLKEDAVSTQLCFLPLQTHIYIWYLSLFGVTLLLLLFWPTNGLGCRHHYDRFMEFIERAIRSNINAAGSKEKVEDDNCDYEMIWDAEGSMHLVKKAVKKVPLTSSSGDLGLTGRGNAVVRPSAKKHSAQETEVSFAVEINSDDTRRVVQINNKSRARMVIQRLIRMFRLLMIIAALNVPLYMMLLFKDWIDQ
ncbi:calcineurin-like metallo-phosphoesterase superfamily protein [Tasmannia lanceolata]|uniref:calcineurin-like metallo-phosphoesterase superfamily protein n=1 Tax=Tasmannia lanceolata TaxID=3420 RepID=UPI004063E3A1